MDDDKARVVDEDAVEQAQQTATGRIGAGRIGVEHEDRRLSLLERLVQ
jgi:hypothetical protein